jgi:hypothetical protein
LAGYDDLGTKKAEVAHMTPEVDLEATLIVATADRDRDPDQGVIMESATHIQDLTLVPTLVLEAVPHLYQEDKDLHLF